MSLNDANGCRHRRRESKKEYHVSSGQIVKHCDNIIICSKNKINLLAFFYEHWFHCFDLLPHNLTLVFAKSGMSLCKQTPFSSDDDDNYMLVSTQEETLSSAYLQTTACIHELCTSVVLRREIVICFRG